MATLAFGIVGGVVGAFFGMPQLGFVVGSLLGQLLFPTKGPTQTGPRLGDLSVQSSAYGIPIPIGFGTFRMAGNIIWAKPLIQVQNTAHASGGKGMSGSSATQITYSYFGSFAIGFAEGPATNVLRIWADKKVAYDARPGTLLNALGTFRFYPGDENQIPDALIEADVGAGLAPAHRGMCYIVFDTIPLTNFGNRIPNIEAEIAFSGSPANPHRFSTNFTVAEGGIFSARNSSIAVDRKRRRIYIIGGNAVTGLRVFDMDSFDEIRQASTQQIYGSNIGFNTFGGFTAGDSGYIYSGLNDQSYAPITQVDPNSLQEVNRFGTASATASPAWPPTTISASTLMAEATVLDPVTGARTHYLASSGIDRSALWIGDVERRLSIWDNRNSPTANIFGIIPLPPQVGAASWYVFVQATGSANNPILIYQLKVVLPYEVLVTDGITLNISYVQVDTIPAATWQTNGSALNGPVVDQRDGTLIFLVQPTSGGGCYVFKWAVGQGVVWETRTVTGYPLNPDVSVGVNSYVSQSRFGWVSSAELAVLIDTSTGAIIIDDIVIGDSNFSSNGAQFYDGDSQSVISMVDSGVLGQIFLGRATGQSVTVQSIVEDISNRVNLVPGTDINATELSDTVIGYAITSHMTAASAIQQLATAFFFDGVESDGLIVFKKRARDPVRTVTKSALMYVDDSGQTDDVVRETRIQEVELPQRLSLNFIDFDLNYLPNSMSATRVGDPVNAGTVARLRSAFHGFRIPKGTIKSHDSQIVNLAIVLSAAQAAQMVEALLFSTWNERMTETFRADSIQIDLDPGDVVNLDLEDGTVITTRVSKSTINADFSTSFEALKMNKFTVVSTRNALGGFGSPGQFLAPRGRTLLFLLDMPLLRDIDDTGGRASRLYLAMNGFTSSWPGGALWIGVDGANFTPTGILATAGVHYGVVADSLPTTDEPFQTDLTTQLRVYMTSGTLVSVSQSDFLNDVNVAIIGNLLTGNWELIDFQNAVQQPDGSYIVSTIMRGRRGTEVNCNVHTNGEFFLIPTPATLESYMLSLGSLNSVRYYRGVGNTELLEDADTEVLSSKGSDLKPYAPCQLGSTTDGSSFTLSWVRRTRIGGALMDGHGDVPLAEDSESYSIDIYNGASVVRTLTSSTPSINYSNTEIVADFGSVPASITFIVYQISAAVGRGFGARFDGSGLVPAPPAHAAREFTNEFTLEFD